MTPEEIEEMKRSGARKDRLHQNYLKKESKWQTGQKMR